MRDVLLDQHQAIFEAVILRDPAAAGAASRSMIYTKQVLDEIAAADARLEVSLRQIDGGSLSSRAQRPG